MEIRRLPTRILCVLGLLSAFSAEVRRAAAQDARKPSFTIAKTAIPTPNGTPVEGRRITGLNVHHTATTADVRGYFARRNDRDSCPTLYIMSDGSVIEFIRPAMQPWSTGRGDRDRVAVEIQNETGPPDWRISDKAGDALVDLLVELATAKTIDGCPVEFKLDRDHVKGHREFNSTACPGPYVFPKLDEYIARAAARVNVTPNGRKTAKVKTSPAPKVAPTAGGATATVNGSTSPATSRGGGEPAAPAPGSEDAVRLTAKAKSYQNSRLWGKALDAYQEVVKQFPGSAEAKAAKEEFAKIEAVLSAK